MNAKIELVIISFYFTVPPGPKPVDVEIDFVSITKIRPSLNPKHLTVSPMEEVT